MDSIVLLHAIWRKKIESVVFQKRSVGDLMAQTGNETAGGDANKAINQGATKN